MTNRNPQPQVGREEMMPPLSSSMSSCVRWQWQDLEDILARQIQMLHSSETQPSDKHGACIRSA